MYFSDPSGLFETWDQAISFMLEHNISGTIRRSAFNDSFVIAGADDNSGRYWENFAETIYDPIVVGQGGGGSGGGSGNGGLGLSSAMWLGNTGLGMLSTDVTLQSGFLKSNELWHKTKTRGYSFATQDKWKNPGAKYWRNQQVKPYQGARKLGSKLTKAGGVLVAADIAMSGELKPSHGINVFMLGISGTGVGSIVAGVWFIADMGTGTYNYYFSNDGFKTISDMIDQNVGSYEMYEGLY